MGQRLADPLDDGLVDLRHLALDIEADALAGLAFQLANDPRDPAEDGLHRLGADRHRRFLQLARQVIEVAQFRDIAELMF